MQYFLVIAICCSMLPASFGAASNDEILMVIHDREITKTEFLRLWEKNKTYPETRLLEDYLELFVNFQLKAAHAREERLHLQASFQNELSGYRRQLALPYLGDPVMEEKLAREAYERLLYDINASHILVRLTPGYSPEDTLVAWEKAIQIRERILAGESFETVARATSDDPSAKTNSGNLGYFTVFQMAYPFENEVYNAEKGNLSMPVRTGFGYHIVRVNDRLNSRGEIKTAHIMIGFNHYGEQEAKEKAGEIHKNLLSGYDFGLSAREYSTDLNTAGQGGILPWFGSGRLVPEFESAAFALENKETISGPVRTNYGWHVIKLLDRREIPPFDEIKNELTDRIRKSRDERYQLVMDALVEKLRKEWDFTENKEALWYFHDMIDNSIFKGNWTIPAGWRLDRVLFTVKGEKITQRDFADFLNENAHRRNPWPLGEYIHSLYDEFVAKWLINHEDKHLENKYPEFRFLMQEYKDGMLLYEITEREVWSRVQEDRAGLADFHRNNRNNYMWDTRILASIFTSDDNNIATRGVRRAFRSRWFGRDIKWITEPLNRGAEEELITVERGIFARGDDPLTDRFGWTECVSDVFQYNEQYRFVIIHEVLEPEPKSLEEARGQVQMDYQDYLENQWVKVLRTKYNVEINKAVLSAIK